MRASAIQQRLQENKEAAKAVFSAVTAAAVGAKRASAEARGTVLYFAPRPDRRDDAAVDATPWEMSGAPQSSGFRVLVASDLALRERSFRLAYRVYLDCAYTVEQEAGLIVSKFDADPSTLVLLIQDSQGRDAATVSLVFDSPAGLPCDEVHGAELAPLRALGCRLVEVTRLAIDLPYVGARNLLIQLFNYISVYARHEEGSTHCVIEVNPRHVNYYRRLLLFEPCGAERRCPRVLGAPARLLKLDLGAQAAEIGMVGGTAGQAHGPRGRTLYSHFYALEEEPRLAAVMRSQQRPMSADELRHFRIERAEDSRRPARVGAGCSGFSPTGEWSVMPGWPHQTNRKSPAATAGAPEICRRGAGANAAAVPS